MYTFIKNLRAKAQEGFTLVELMVVVAIIGLLSAVAIPNFKKYQAKSKTSEAKLQLSAIYTAEQSYYMDFDNYGTCLNVMGFDPSNEVAQRYYAVGFDASNTAAGNLATANGASTVCGATGVTIDATSPTPTEHAYLYGAGKKVGAAAALVAASAAAQITTAEAVANDGQTFTAAAVGVISTDRTAAGSEDFWTITESKRIAQVRVGF